MFVEQTLESATTRLLKSWNGFGRKIYAYAGPYAEGVRRCNRTPLAEQIVSKSYSFSPETEFTPLILA